MNFLKAEVSGAGKVKVPALGGREVETQVALPAVGSPVTLGLRPQQLGVHHEASPITVDIRERPGGVADHYLKTPTGERIVVEIKGDDPIEEGAAVALDFNPARAFFFDPQTTLRLR